MFIAQFAITVQLLLLVLLNRFHCPACVADYVIFICDVLCFFEASLAEISFIYHEDVVFTSKIGGEGRFVSRKVLFFGIFLCRCDKKLKEYDHYCEFCTILLQSFLFYVTM